MLYHIIISMTELQNLIERISSSDKKIISIEGAIGIGKTTLGKSIVKFLNTVQVVAKFYTEPFNQKMLELFLSDMKKYAYSFQLYMLTRRQLDYNDAYHDRNNTISVLDRSLTGDYVFMSLQKKYGNVSDVEFDTYVEEYNKFVKYKPDVVIYLNVDPDIMRQRIATRNRPGETTYDLQYLVELQNQYNVILPSHISSEKIITVDWNNDVLDENGDVKTDVLIALLQQMF